MKHFISNHFLRHYARLTRDHQLDPYILLHDIGISRKVLDQEYSVLPLEQFVRLLAHTRAEPKGKSIVLLLAQQQDMSVFGPLIPKLQECHNIQALLVVLQLYIQSIIPGLTIHQQQHLDNFMVSFTHEEHQVINNVAFCEYALSFSFHLLQQLIPIPLQFRSVFFPTAEPAHSFVSHYQQLFHCPIAFNQRQLALCFHPDILTLPVQNITQPLIDRLSSQPTKIEDIVRQIEELISLGLSSGNVSIEAISQGIGLHPRKLQRLLRSESLNFSQILNRVRRQHAQQYLTQTQYDISSIAYMVGYQNLATFSRECQKWFGMSPSNVRHTTTNDLSK